MNGKRVVTANVGKVAEVTVDLIKRGVSVHNLADTYPADVIAPGEESLWFVSAPKGSALEDTVLTIPLAFTEHEAWELAIQHLGSNYELSEDLKGAVKTHRRTLRKLWRDMCAHGNYAIFNGAQAADHYGSPFGAWERLMCWLDGAATGFCDDDCWMPFTWRLMGRTAADWNSSLVKVPAGHKVPAIGCAEPAADR